MSNSSDDTTPRRFRRLPNGGPLRSVTPWIAIVVGSIMTAKGVIDLQSRGYALFIFVGLGLFIAGVTAFLINRARERRH